MEFLNFLLIFFFFQNETPYIKIIIKEKHIPYDKS